MLLAMNGNGGWGMNNPFWMIFMLPFLYPFFNMFGGWGNGFGGGNFGGGTGFLANQLNNDAGRDLIMQGIQGNHEAISSLASMLNTDISAVQSGLNIVGSKIQEVGSQVGMSGLQVINAIQAGNSSLASQLANCCCENRLATCQQTNTITSQIAAHDANVRLQLAQNEAADQLSVCQQTNTLTRQADGNTNTIVKAIADQNAMIVKEFCDLKERELQDKINTQGDIITQLRNQISNDKQTLQFNSAFQALDNKIDAIAAKQPNTVPVTWPNLVAANATPYVGGYGYGYGNGFGNNIVF
jgi:hypothetical protein